MTAPPELGVMKCETLLTILAKYEKVSVTFPILNQTDARAFNFTKEPLETRHLIRESLSHVLDAHEQSPMRILLLQSLTPIPVPSTERSK
jgi:hypothetical protein